MTGTPLRRRITGLIAVAVLGASVVSCAGQDQDATNAPQTDMDGVAVTAGANQPAEVNEVDLHFVAMMTPHHQQAVDMSEIILTAEGTSAATADLADRIKVGQQEEIDSMVGWAEQWDQHDLMAHHAPPHRQWHDHPRTAGPTGNTCGRGSRHPISPADAFSTTKGPLP